MGIDMDEIDMGCLRSDFAEKLINSCDKIHLFVIVIDGNYMETWDDDHDIVPFTQLRETLAIYKLMFGTAFREHMCVVFNRVSMDKKQISLRERHRDGKTDDERAAEA